MKFKNKKCLVYGMGDSGRSAIKFLTSLGAHVFFYDDDIKYIGQVGFVNHVEKEKFDYCIISPGVKIKNNPYIEMLKQSKTKIFSELDLGYMFCKGKIIAITGTNGKTTTCMLINKILKENGYKTFLCGNIGVPITSICKKTTKESVVVCEVSSFQLEGSSMFKCEIGAITNIKEDHLERHGTMQEYINCKEKLLSFSKISVLNLDDDISKKLVLNKKNIFFSKKVLKKGVFIKQNSIYCNKKELFNLNYFNLKGEKNLENLLCAIAVTSCFKISKKGYEKALSSFQLAGHRLEEIGVFNGITFVDDSKATNVSSTLNAISAYDNFKLILLLGGHGKGCSYDELFEKKFKKVVTFGDDGKRIYEIAQKYEEQVFNFAKFEEAVRFAYNSAEKGDIVLLSPACSSYDEFSSYIERGEKFKEIILELISGKK